MVKFDYGLGIVPRVRERLISGLERERERDELKKKKKGIQRFSKLCIYIVTVVTIHIYTILVCLIDVSSFWAKMFKFDTFFYYTPINVNTLNNQILQNELVFFS